MLWLAATPLLLGGLLPLSPEISDRWCLAGRWTFPVASWTRKKRSSCARPCAALAASSAPAATRTLATSPDTPRG